jgi:hypothetical protein
MIVEFMLLVFERHSHERPLWADFTALKAAAGLDFPSALHWLALHQRRGAVEAIGNRGEVACKR